MYSLNSLIFYMMSDTISEVFTYICLETMSFFELFTYICLETMLFFELFTYICLETMSFFEVLTHTMRQCQSLVTCDEQKICASY